MKLRVTHTTHYSYETDAIDSVNEVRMRPVGDVRQICDSFQLYIDPWVAYSEYRDFYQNAVNVFEVSHEHRELSIRAISEVRTFKIDPLPEGPVGLSWKRLPEEAAYDDYYEFLVNSASIDVSPEVWRVAIDVSETRDDLWDCVLGVMEWVYQELKYDKDATTVFTPMVQAFALRRGVCQDYAHIMIGLLRAIHIPARYVSGYFWAPESEHNEAAGASHAWVETFVPGFGWVGLDPTHNRLVDERYVKVGIGRDYNDVRPIQGTYRGSPNRTMDVVVHVERKLELDSVEIST